DEGGGIGAWDLRAARHALAGVLRRRPEAYHEILRRHEAEAAAHEADAAVAAMAAGVASVGVGAAEPGEAVPASIHEMVHVKEPGLAARLIYDDYERRSGLVRILPADVALEAWAAGGRGDLGDFVHGPFRVVRLAADRVTLARDGLAMIDGSSMRLELETSIVVGGGRLDPTLDFGVTVENRSERTLEARIGVEWALTM